MNIQGKRKGNSRPRQSLPAPAGALFAHTRRPMAGSNRRADMKIVVIGCSGLIGSKLVGKLCQLGH